MLESEKIKEPTKPKYYLIWSRLERFALAVCVVVCIKILSDFSVVSIAIVCGLCFAVYYLRYSFLPANVEYIRRVDDYRTESWAYQAQLSDEYDTAREARRVDMMKKSADSAIDDNIAEYKKQQKDKAAKKKWWQIW